MLTFHLHFLTFLALHHLFFFIFLGLPPIPSFFTPLLLSTTKVFNVQSLIKFNALKTYPLSSLSRLYFSFFSFSTINAFLGLSSHSQSLPFHHHLFVFLSFALSLASSKSFYFSPSSTESLYISLQLSIPLTFPSGNFKHSSSSPLPLSPRLLYSTHVPRALIGTHQMLNSCCRADRLLSFACSPPTPLTWLLPVCYWLSVKLSLPFSTEQSRTLHVL